MDPNANDDEHDDGPAALRSISEEALKDRLDPDLSWPASLDRIDPHHSTSCREPYDKAGELYRRYVSARAAHAADKRLTAEGKAEADAETAQALLPEVAKLQAAVRRSVEGVNNNLAKMTATALKVPDHDEDPFAPDPAEIRGWLRSLPADERDDAVEKLVKAGDVRALRSILSAPEVLSGVSSKIAQELRGDVIEKSDPKRYRAIMAVLEGYGAAEKALDGLARFLAFDTSPEGVRDRLSFPDTPAGQLQRIRASR